MKRCGDCIHWEKFNSSYPEYGECRIEAPRMSGMLLFVRSQFFGSMSPVIQNQSTLWPVTKDNQFCDQWED